MNNFFISFVFVILVLFLPAAFASDDCGLRVKALSCAYNPKPLADDLLLPMPLGFAMAFRRVDLSAGESFWGDSERLVKLGDITGAAGEEGIFENVLNFPLHGSFFDRKNNNWHYFLGKYEVSLGQFLAVMSLDENLANPDLNRGLNVLQTLDYDAKTLQALRNAKSDSARFRLYAEPLSGVDIVTIYNFLQKYTLWCYQDAACNRALPRLSRKDWREQPAADSLPGFFRLPNESEWEYAARGGLTALREGNFSKKLPFDDKNWATFARANQGSVQRIGQTEATVGGFHDLFGNIQELTDNSFLTESIQGKMGGQTVRGGSFLSKPDQLRASWRSEQPPYQMDSSGKLQPQRSPSTGLRISIGMPVLLSVEQRRLIAQEFADYKKSASREETPAIRALRDTSMRDVASALRELEGIKSRAPANLQPFLGSIAVTLETAQQEIREESQLACNAFVRVAMNELANATFALAKIRQAERGLNKIKALENPSPLILRQKESIESAIGDYQRIYQSNLHNYPETLSAINRYDAKARQAALSAARAFHRERSTPYYDRYLAVISRHLEKSADGRSPEDLPLAIESLLDTFGVE